MEHSRANWLYRSGLSLLSEGCFAQAAAKFRGAIAVERESGVGRPHGRYLSFYGLSRALAESPSLEDVRLCERAAEEDSFDPLLLLNLGRVYLLAGRTTKALAAFERGLRLDPDDRRLRAMLARSDRRAKPLIARLGRDHPINRSLGRLRVSLRGRSRAQARSARAR